MASNGEPQLNDDSGSETEDDVTETSPTPPLTTKNKSKGKRKKPEAASASNQKASNQKSWSQVWDHFQRPENDKTKAICNYCKKVFVAPSGNGTSNLKKHNMVSCKAFSAWTTANSGKKDQTVLSSDGSDVRLCKMSEKVIREASNEMIVLASCLYLSLRAWHGDISAVAMKKILDANKQRLSLTTDIWVAPHTGASYMVITAHFIDAWWQLRKLIIGFKNVYDHKGATIAKVLLDCMAEWDIKRVFCVTVDNATANSNAMETFKKEFKHRR
ncbi:unnamed protein product [Microthlaspi erraticum]|uniref:BED-type domain-containing protein n=1 Tax=Microthlaspi erraticum TaxID=1685480 RepID=A0A6D2IUA4_9BRAS|nr:unnamed protein product [Microthlaspi erraticum]